MRQTSECDNGQGQFLHYLDGTDFECMCCINIVDYNDMETSSSDLYYAPDNIVYENSKILEYYTK